MSDVLNLITETYTTDIYGNETSVETKKEVFCEVRSVSKTEYYSAGETGHRPVFRFDVFRYDYNNEKLAEYDGQKYYIYRVYFNNDTAELYTEERIGI